jgi:hypothetical protein
MGPKKVSEQQKKARPANRCAMGVLEQRERHYGQHADHDSDAVSGHPALQHKTGGSVKGWGEIRPKFAAFFPLLCVRRLAGMQTV